MSEIIEGTNETAASTKLEATIEKLREALLRGRFPAGTSVRENDVCVLCEVSRTPARSAMLALHREGLLDYVAQKGYRARRFEITSTQDAYAIRGVVEGLACRLLVERGLTAAVVPRLKALVARGENLIRDAETAPFDAAAWRHMNAEFHQVLLEPMNHVFHEVSGYARRVPYADSATTADWRAQPDIELIKNAQNDHRKIVNALANNEATRAEELMREHLYNAGEVLRHTLDATKMKDLKGPGGG
jgi:GntR family transcriptional regulator, vanillate catabolism transcriptional regulator